MESETVSRGDREWLPGRAALATWPCEAYRDNVPPISVIRWRGASQQCPWETTSKVAITSVTLNRRKDDWNAGAKSASCQEGALRIRSLIARRAAGGQQLPKGTVERHSRGTWKPDGPHRWHDALYQGDIQRAIEGEGPAASDRISHTDECRT